MFRSSGPSRLAPWILALGVLAAACGPDATDDLRRRTPRLPDRWIDALATGSFEDFERFARGTSADYLLLAESELYAGIETGSPEAFRESRAALVPALSRVRKVLRSEYGFEAMWELHQRFAELPEAPALEMQSTWARAHDVASDTTLTFRQRATRVEFMAARLDSLDAPVRTAHLWLKVHGLLFAAGSPEAERTLRRALDRSLAQGDYVIAAQALGVLGSYAQSKGDSAGMDRSWGRALQIATRHRLAEQKGRIVSFYANYHRARGRLALARRLLQEADEACEELGGSPRGLRFLLLSLDFDADLECWGAVETGLVRAPRLLERMQAWSGGEDYADERAAQIDIYRGRAANAAGEFDRANDLFARAEHEYIHLHRPSKLQVLRLTWARALLDQGQPAMALDKLMADLPGDSRTTASPALPVLIAEAHADLGQWDACERALAEFEAQDPDSWTLRFREVASACALSIRIARSRGDIAEISRAIEASCDRLDRQLARMEASQEIYLSLRHLERLGRVLHEIVEPYPVLEYRFERAWRQVPAMIGSSGANGGSIGSAGSMASPLHQCARIVDRALRDQGEDASLTLVPEAMLPPDGPIELLYRTGAHSLERWTRVGDQLAHSTLPMNRVSLEQGVAALLEDLGRERAPGDVPDRDLIGDLHDLARLILPETVLAARGDGCRELLIDPGLPLDGFAFGALNLSGDSYVPLISRYDPVYRSPRTTVFTGAATAGPGLIVADPDVDPVVAAWESGLPRLDHGIREARALHEWYPGSVLLERGEATEAAIMRAWETAPFIYFASHVVHDPTVPYLSYIPLAPPPGVGGHSVLRADEYLDIQDIRAARLRGRPLVVLSACSSGAPFRTRGALAPSLGDAFLSAGASTVFQNLWSVQDAAAAELMQRAMRAWAVDGAAPVQALNDARRHMAADRRLAHPYFWGGAVVKKQDR